MKNGKRNRESLSRTTWDGLEEFVRVKCQGFIQDLLEEEVDAFLGRERYERRPAVDPQEGSRNGYGKPRKLSMMVGTITVRRPRIRNLDERFESRIIPFFVRRTKEIAELLPELYLHGLSTGDFELALRGLLGDGAPLSPTSIERLKARWQLDYDEWKTRRLDDLEVVYVWADGVYVKAGLEKEKAALLVIMGALRDGRKTVLSVVSGFRESKESWESVLRDLKERGLRPPKLVCADGAAGIWSALGGIWPEAAEQRCWNHKIRNVVDCFPKRLQPEAKELLRQLPYAETKADAEKLRKKFEIRYKKEHPKAVETLERDWERMITFYGFPKDHWKHLRTTNIVESPFDAVRIRTNAGKRYKKTANATTLIWKVLMVAEKRFRKLDAPELLNDVWLGVKYESGVPIRRRVVEQREKEKAA